MRERVRSERLNTAELDVDGLRIHHSYGGTGSPPLLLIHGLGSAGYIEWRFNLGPLAESHRVLAPDLPGFGRSEKPSVRYGIPFFARTIERYLEHVEVGRVNVVGASLGGRVAMELAVRRNARIDRLVLVNSLGLGRPRMQPFYPLVTVPRVGETVMRLMNTGLQRSSPELVKRVIARYLGRGADVDRLVDDVYLSDLREMHASDRYPDAYLATVRSLLNPASLVAQRKLLQKLAGTGIPILLVWGTEDRLFPVEHATRAHLALPRSRVALIDGAGHTPQAERPEEFNRLVSEFVRAGR